MMRLFRNDLNYLLELDGMVFGSNANVSRLIVEYCNKVYLNDLKHRYEIPESILNLKSYAEANLKQVNSPLFLEVNENFTDTKLWMEKILAEDDEEKRKKKKAEEKGIKKPRLNPVYVFSFLIALIIVMCFVLYKILAAIYLIMQHFTHDSVKKEKAYEADNRTFLFIPLKF
jgi:hypothetical protein